MMKERRIERWFERYRRKGDPRALARVFDATARDLLALACHLVRDPAEAEDLLQATFLTAIERAESYDARRALVPWLTGILSNHASMHRRRAARVPSAERLAGRGVPDPAEQLAAAEVSGALRDALARVSERDRAVLQPYLVEGLAPEEIARALGRAPGTVRMQIHRGLGRLRTLLPAGLSASALWLAVAPRGLESVRATVLAHASVAAAGAGGGVLVASGTGIGGLLVGKQTLSVAVAAVLSLAAVGWWSASGSPAPATLVGGERARSALASASPELLAARDAAGADDARREPPTQPAEPASRPGLWLEGRVTEVAAQHLGELRLRVSLLGASVGEEAVACGPASSGAACRTCHDPALETPPSASLADPPNSSAASLASSGCAARVEEGDCGLCHAAPSEAPPPEVRPSVSAPLQEALFFDLSAPPLRSVLGRIDSAAVDEGGRFHVDLTPFLGLLAEGEEHFVEVEASHPLYFEGHTRVELRAGVARRALAGAAEVLHAELACEGAAVLRGEVRVAGREPEYVELHRLRTDGVLRLDGALEGKPYVVESWSEGEGAATAILLHYDDGVELALFDVVEGVPQARALRTMRTTAPFGEFEMRLPRGGDFLLVAVHGDRRPFAARVELALGELRELEPIELEPGARLAGIVQGSGLLPEGAVEVQARHAGAVERQRSLGWRDGGLLWTGESVEWRERRAMVAPDRGFELEGLAPGAPYDLGAWPRSYVLIDDDAFAERIEAGGADEALSVVAPAFGLELELAAALLVLHASVGGESVPWADNRLRGAVLAVERFDPSRRRQVGQLGRYERALLVLEPGRELRFTLAAPGHAPARVGWTAPQPGGAGELWLDLRRE